MSKDKEQNNLADKYFLKELLGKVFDENLDKENNRIKEYSVVWQQHDTDGNYSQRRTERFDAKTPEDAWKQAYREGEHEKDYLISATPVDNENKIYVLTEKQLTTILFGFGNVSWEQSEFTNNCPATVKLNKLPTNYNDWFNVMEGNLKSEK